MKRALSFLLLSIVTANLGCAATPRPSSLTDAQSSLAADDITDLSERSPTLLREARAAYVEGEDSYRSGDFDEARVLGYIALARVGIARDLAAKEAAERMSAAFDEALASSGKERIAAGRLAEMEQRLQSVNVGTDPVAVGAKSQVVSARNAQAGAIRRGMPTQAGVRFEEGRVLLDGAVEALGLGLFADARDAARRAESIFVGTQVADATKAALPVPAAPAKPTEAKAEAKTEAVVVPQAPVAPMESRRTYDFAESKVSQLELEAASAMGDGREQRCPAAFKEFNALVSNARARLDRNDVARALEFAVRAEERFGKCDKELTTTKGGKAAEATPKADDRRAQAEPSVAAAKTAACAKGLTEAVATAEQAMSKRTTPLAVEKSLLMSAKALADAGRCDEAGKALEPVTAALSKPDRDAALDDKVEDALSRGRMAKVQALRARNNDTFRQADRNLVAATDRAKASPADALRFAEEAVVLFRSAFDEWSVQDATDQQARQQGDERAKAERATKAAADAQSKKSEDDGLLKAALDKLAAIEAKAAKETPAVGNDNDRAAQLQRQEEEADAAIRAATVAFDLCEQEKCELRDGKKFRSGREALRAARRAFGERKYVGATAVAVEARDELVEARRSELPTAAPAADGNASALAAANARAAEAEARAAAVLAALSAKDRATEEEKQLTNADKAVRAAKVELELCVKQQCEERDAGLFFAGRGAVNGADKALADKRYVAALSFAEEGMARLKEAQQVPLANRDVQADDARRLALSAQESCGRLVCAKRDAQLEGDARRSLDSAQSFLTQKRFDDAIRLFTDAKAMFDAAAAKQLPIEMPTTLKRVRLEGTQLVLSPKLNFVSGTAKLTKNSAPGVDELALVLKQNQASLSSIKILGYTDNKGKPEKNTALSRDRAMSVREALAQRGVPAEMFGVVDGMGDQQPVADNATSAGREQNRRVEIHVVLK